MKADSFDEAYQHAEKYAVEACDDHINPYGQRVRTEIYGITDCFLAFDEEYGVREVYSTITRNKTNLSNDEFVDMLVYQCDKNELYILRYEEFNKPADISEE